MKQRQNLVLRGGTYSVRMMIPKDVRSFYGTTREKLKALGTGDKAEAEARKHAVLAAFHEEFQAHRRRREPGFEETAKAAEEVYRLALADDMDRRDSLLNESAYEAERDRLYRELQDGDELDKSLADLRSRRATAGGAVRWRDGWEAALRHHIAVGESVLVSDLADHIVQREGYSISKQSVPYTRFCRELIKAQLRAIEKMKDRDRGVFDDVAQPPTVRGPTLEPAKLTGPTIAERLDLYVAENPHRVSAGTLVQNRLVVELFAQFLGGPAVVSQITRAKVAEWRRALRSWPDRASQRREFEGLSFAAIIEKNATLKVPTITDKTINRYLGGVGAFCKWLTHEDCLDVNPVSNMWIKVDKTEKKRSPFSSDQLSRLFSSPVFTGCMSSKKDHTPGSTLVRDHRFWLPLIALWSGARITEIAQLSVDDLKEQEGAWVFVIATVSDTDIDKKLKTATSRRLVPVHPMLIKLGLLQHRDATRLSGARRLFPEITPDSRGEIGARPSRWFGRYSSIIKIKTPDTAFHSFRHGFADALRRAGYHEGQFGPLLGHAPTTITSGYGAEQSLTLAQRVEMIGKITYPGLDLSNLLPATVPITAQAA